MNVVSIKRKCKNYFNLCRHRQRDIEKTLRDFFFTQYSFHQILQEVGLQLHCVVYAKNESPNQNLDKLKLSFSKRFVNQTEQEITDNERTNDLKVIKAVDRSYISHVAYTFLRRQTNLNLPSIYFLKKHVDEITS